MTKRKKSRRWRKPSPLAQSPWLTIPALILLGIGVGLISMMLGAAYFGMPMFYAYFGSPVLVALNLLPPLFIIFLAYSLGGRAWIAFLITSVIILALSIVDFFKIQVRSEPLIISDFALAGEAGNEAAGYVLVVNWKVYLAAAYIVIGTLLSFVFLKYKPECKTRLIGSSVIVMLSVLAYATLYSSEKLYNKTEAPYAINIWSNAEKSIARGFTYPFVYNLQDDSSKPPDGYKADKAAALLASYTDDAVPDGKKVSIVSVMLESYADLSTFGLIVFKEDVYAPLHALQTESVYGALVTNTFAGGTINSERSFLTGYTYLDDCQTVTNSYVWYLKQQGYYAEGFHSGHNWYYDRDKVNFNLGFDSYYFLEDFETEDRTDAYFFSEVLNLYEERDMDVPYFSYNLSYQNHGPYDSETTCDTIYIEQGSLSDSSRNILNNYLEGIADTTERIAGFIDYFRELDEPVVVVMFGDHMPWLGNSYEGYHELGVNIDLSTEEGFYNFYKTPYLIWANDAAKDLLDNEFTGYGGDISPCFLMNEVFRLCSFEGNAFMKVSNELFSTVDIVSAAGYYRENGILAPELSDGLQSFYRNYEIIEYYYQHNYSY